MNTIRRGQTSGTESNNNLSQKKSVDSWRVSNKTADVFNQKAELCDEQPGGSGRDLVSMGRKPPMSSAKWSIDSLINYSINNHHPNIERNAVLIYELAQKVGYRPDRNHPELQKLVASLFFFLHDLFNHLKREKQTFFPEIRQFVKNRNCEATNGDSPSRFIEGYNESLKNDQDTAGKDLILLRSLTNNYCPPANACSTHKFLFEKMKEFEDSLLSHFDFKENILNAVSMDKVE